MRPIPCPLPEKRGIYWLKVAERGWTSEEGLSWDSVEYSWLLAEVDPTRYFEDGSRCTHNITAMMGSDEMMEWENERDGIIVECRGPIEEPEF